MGTGGGGKFRRPRFLQQYPATHATYAASTKDPIQAQSSARKRCGASSKGKEQSEKGGVRGRTLEWL